MPTWITKLPLPPGSPNAPRNPMSSAPPHAILRGARIGVEHGVGRNRGCDGCAPDVEGIVLRAGGQQQLAGVRIAQTDLGILRGSAMFVQPRDQLLASRHLAGSMAMPVVDQLEEFRTRDPDADVVAAVVDPGLDQRGLERADGLEAVLHRALHGLAGQLVNQQGQAGHTDREHGRRDHRRKPACSGVFGRVGDESEMSSPEHGQCERHRAADK